MTELSEQSIEDLMDESFAEFDPKGHFITITDPFKFYRAILALINKEKAKANKEWFKAGYDKGLYDGNQLPVNFEMLRHSMDKLTTQLNSIEAQLTKEGGQMIDERETEAYKKGFIDGGLSFVKKAKHSSKEDV